MQIQISWLLQKPTDLDLHCLLRQGMSCSARGGLKADAGYEERLRLHRAFNLIVPLIKGFISPVHLNLKNKSICLVLIKLLPNKNNYIKLETIVHLKIGHVCILSTCSFKISLLGLETFILCLTCSYFLIY